MNIQYKTYIEAVALKQLFFMSVIVDVVSRLPTPLFFFTDSCPIVCMSLKNETKAKRTNASKYVCSKLITILAE